MGAATPHDGPQGVHEAQDGLEWPLHEGIGCDGDDVVRIGKTGTERCAFCRLEEHDEIFQAWAQGDLTAEEIGAQVDVSASAWMKHLSRHVPNYRVLAAEVAVVYGGEVERVRARILAEAEGAMDPTDREHLLEIGVLILRGHLLAMAAKGISADPGAARASRDLVSEVEKATAALENIRRERAESEALANLRRKEDGWAALDRFKRDLDTIFEGDPELGARLNDLLAQQQGGLDQEGEGSEAGVVPEVDPSPNQDPGITSS